MMAHDVYWFCLEYHALERSGKTPQVDNFCHVYNLDEAVVKGWIALYRKHLTKADFILHYK